MNENYVVWQHRSGTKAMSIGDARRHAESLEHQCQTPRGTITQDDKVEIMPAGIEPGSAEWSGYQAKLRKAGKRRL